MGLLFLLLTLPPAPRTPTLRLSTQACYAPCDVVVLSHRTAHPDDREWTIALYAKGEDVPDRSSAISLEGLAGDTGRRLFWNDLMGGMYTLTSCITPSGGCATTTLFVHDDPEP